MSPKPNIKNTGKLQKDVDSLNKHFSELNPKCTRKPLKLPREELCKLSGLITEHCTMNQHMLAVNQTDKPCRECLTNEESPYHVLQEKN